MSMQSPNPRQLSRPTETTISESPYWRRIVAQAKLKAKEYAGVKTGASIIAGALVASAG